MVTCQDFIKDGEGGERIFQTEHMCKEAWNHSLRVWKMFHLIGALGTWSRARERKPEWVGSTLPEDHTLAERQRVFRVPPVI